MSKVIKTKKYFCPLSNKEVILTQITSTIQDGNSVYSISSRTYFENVKD